MVDGSGNILSGPENVAAAGIAWGERDDSFRTQADGRVTWVQGDPNSAQLTLYIFNGAAFLP